MFKRDNIIKLSSLLLALFLVVSCVLTPHVSAKKGVGFTVSPMVEKVVLNPGDVHSSSLTVIIPSEYEDDMKYTVEVAPFYVNENYENDFNNEYGTSNEIVKWITIDTPKTGKLAPGERTTVQFTINVPKDAPGGGQYASILIGADLWKEGDEDEGDSTTDSVGTSVKEVKKIAYIIYAEIAGDIVRQGEIEDLNVPGFLLSGDIKGSSSVKNTGNVHGEAKYKLQVFPLFSDEEIYTNEEKPADRTVLPDRTLYNEITWPGTPAFGIFNVVYTVEFEGVTGQIKKLVIKCPVWLLFIIIFAIIALIIWVFLLIKKRRNVRRD